MSALSPRQMFLLDNACHAINDGLGDFGCYLVGTATSRGQYRDVDVRFIMKDKKHDRLTKAIGQGGVSLLGITIGQYLASLTGLPIDFQIQRQTEANALHPNGNRNPLGTRSLSNYKGDAQTADMDRMTSKGQTGQPSDVAVEPAPRMPPHSFSPDWHAMGDCSVCGQASGSAIHATPDSEQGV